MYPSTEPFNGEENKQPFKIRREQKSKDNKMTGDRPLTFFIFLKFLIINNNNKSLPLLVN